MSVDLLRCALPDAAQPELAARARRPFLRDRAVEALAIVRAHPRGAGARLSGWFRRERRLGSRDRPVVAEAVYGMVRHQSLLIRAAGASDVQAVTLHETWCRLVEGDRFDDLSPGEPAADYATALSLPKAIAAEWLQVLGPAEAARLARTFAGRAPFTIRANAARCSRDELAKRLADEGVSSRPCAMARHGLHLDRRVPVGSLGSFREGWFEVQDEASQLLCERIARLPGKRILDLCAGAGGKSLALAASGAEVQAWDIRRHALCRLRDRARRAGAFIRIAPPAPAEIVLVDAPCCGVGRLRREPTLRLDLDPNRYLARQRALVARAAELVKPGGWLVYATCSLLAAENDPPVPDGFEPVERRLLWPHRTDTDGFGWLILRR